ncbi:hypothetical protein KOY49_00990 [Candidatus Minimicrobia vallesae]|uniref:Uncharacterized protein n=1 Tax=Candidatus Minimicrobia vallesae TaxID=2841264 RepID=A0A8F1MBJ3_9BACT|nr:hypothetical protein [Candidatus Minimicrobia vallesae]QWQ31578.1 hypothetical protein KOY49_00990 [Candidatus Minimicrobia vallesae]
MHSATNTAACQTLLQKKRVDYATARQTENQKQFIMSQRDFITNRQNTELKSNINLMECLLWQPHNTLNALNVDISDYPKLPQEYPERKTPIISSTRAKPNIRFIVRILQQKDFLAAITSPIRLPNYRHNLHNTAYAVS